MSYTPAKTIQYAFRNCVRCDSMNYCRNLIRERFSGNEIIPEECHRRSNMITDFEQYIKRSKLMIVI